MGVRKTGWLVLGLLLVSAIGGAAFGLGAISPAAAQELAPPSDIVPTNDPADMLADLRDEGSLSARVLQLFALVTILSLAPGIAMMVTCLPFMAIVFSFMRQAVGIQQAPPNMMIMALAVFLTFFVMEPVFDSAWTSGVSPYLDGQITEDQAIARTLDPFRTFMSGRVDPESIAVLQDSLPGRQNSAEAPSFALLSTAFMLSEIKHAFQIGFAIFLPFMIIDLVVASILMAMGMMMVPPTVVSLPFKVGFFVLADGWLRITQAVLTGYGG